MCVHVATLTFDRHRNSCIVLLLSRSSELPSISWPWFWFPGKAHGEMCFGLPVLKIAVEKWRNVIFYKCHLLKDQYNTITFFMLGLWVFQNMVCCLSVNFSNDKSHRYLLPHDSGCKWKDLSSDWFKKKNSLGFPTVVFHARIFHSDIWHGQNSYVLGLRDTGEFLSFF